MRQAIIWTNGGLLYSRLHVFLGLDVLKDVIVTVFNVCNAWWRHQMETFSA